MNAPRRFRSRGEGYAPGMHHGVWELVFLMVILKIPIAYLIGVIWYAIKAKPLPGAGAGITAQVGPDPTDGGRGLRPRRFGGPRPHGGPTRTYPRAPRTAGARAEADRP